MVEVIVIKCPECGSHAAFKDGLRYSKIGLPIQRFLCRTCGYRFSEPNKQIHVFNQVGRLDSCSQLANSSVCNRDFSIKEVLKDHSLSFGEDVGSHNVTIIGKRLNSLRSYNSSYQIGVLAKKAKNLAIATENVKVAVGEKTTNKEITEGKIVEFLWQLKREGRSDLTLRNNKKALSTLAKKGADLLEPNSVKDVIAQQNNWKPSTKAIVSACYKKFAKNNQIPFESPCYKQTRKLPFIPLEEELDSLIAGCGKKVSTMLQLLKETGARLGEGLRINWIDIDQRNSTIVINEPEKGSNPRMFKVSTNLIAMLNRLPKTNDKVFANARVTTFESNFRRQRKTLAAKLNNPRLLKIHFHTLRHWKATTEYARTKDLLHVQAMLGHRAIQNTMLYTQLIPTLKNEEYYHARPKTPEEEDKLIDQGWEYVRFDDRTQCPLYRKRK